MREIEINNILILGSGPGAFSVYADLTIEGYNPVLSNFSAHQKRLKSVFDNGHLKVTGIYEKNIPVHFNFDVIDAIKNSSFIIVCASAYTHQHFSMVLNEHCSTDTTIMFLPGKFSSYRVSNHFNVIEAATMPYAARFTSDSSLNFIAKKNIIRLADNCNGKALKTLASFFPIPYKKLDTIFEVNLQITSSAIHAVSTIFNMGKIEDNNPYPTKGYDISPSMAKIMEKIDSEKRALAKFLNIGYTPMLDILKEMYPSNSNNLYDFYKTTKVYESLMSPHSLHHRYLTEEIPYHLVPLYLCSIKCGIEMPTVFSLISICSTVLEVDYLNSCDINIHKIISSFER